MSMHEEERFRCYKENIPKLIKLLTNYGEKDENFIKCKQFVYSKLKYPKHTSVNSHEVRRRIDGFLERVSAENYQDYAQKFRKLFNCVIEDPLFVIHDQHDINWGLINFLFELAQNPIQELSREIAETPNKNVHIFDQSVIEPTVNINRSIIKILEADNFKYNVKNDVDSNSDLSEWSESEDEFGFEFSSDLKFDSNAKNENSLKGGDSVQKWKIVTYLEPPKKPKAYTIFDGSESDQWIAANLQPPWWKDNNFQCDVNSPFYEAYCGQISNSTNISTISEYCLLREIFWMFTVPTNCKCFRIENGIVVCNRNVTIPSVTPNVLRHFLDLFCEHMTIMLQLKFFCSEILSPLNKRNKYPPLTYQTYAKCVAEFLESIHIFVVKKEHVLVNLEENGERVSIMKLFHEMYEHFKLLKFLHQIHVDSILSYHENAAHICSAYLLAQLNSFIKNSSNKEETNLAFTLYINALSVFISIIDTWWIEGKLDDWHNEFILEEMFAEEGYNIRPLKKSRLNSFHIESSISSKIVNDEIIKMLIDIFERSTSSLKILIALDRFGDLKIENESKSGIYSENMFKSFFDNVITDLKNINATFNLETRHVNIVSNDQIADENYCKNEFNRKEFEQEILDMGDEFLLLAFQESLIIAEQQTNIINSNEIELAEFKSKNILLYEKLNSTFSIILPYTTIITNGLQSLLEKKFAVVNRFITHIYKDEFNVLYHLQNLRRILLLEASDLMFEFYTNLFEQIENCDSVLNGYHLTIQLNALVCSRYSNAMFNVELMGNNKSLDGLPILEAIKLIRINYDVPSTLTNLITEVNLTTYNKIFQLILKTKWAISVLDNLHFPDFFKNRLPYAKLTNKELIYRRLAMLRVWLTFSINNIHTYLMSEVIHLNSIKMDADISNAQSLPEIVAIHENFLTKIKYQCFQNEDQKNMLVAIMQFFNLISVLSVEWQTGSESNETVDKVEEAYIECHRFIADMLAKENYMNNNTHLDTLSAAFNCSIPY